MLNTPNSQPNISPSYLDGAIRRFSDAFARERTAFLQSFTLANAHIESYASLLLNRFMFLFFLQYKGLLDADPDYLANRLLAVQQQFGPDTYHHNFLLPLFHQGLSAPSSHRSPAITT